MRAMKRDCTGAFRLALNLAHTLRMLLYTAQVRMSITQPATIHSCHLLLFNVIIFQGHLQDQKAFVS